MFCFLFCCCCQGLFYFVGGFFVVVVVATVVCGGVCLGGRVSFFFFLSQGLLVYFCYIAFELLVLFWFFNSTGLRFHLSLPPYQFSVDTFILSLRFCYHLLFLEQFPVSIPSSTHIEITSATTTTSSKCLGL